MRENLKPSWRLVGNGAANVIEVDLHKLTREFLVKLWVDDRKMRNPRDRVKSFGGYGDPRWFSATSAVPRRPKRRAVLKQPPISQSVSDFFDPQSPEEVNSSAFILQCSFFLLNICGITYVR